MGASGVVTVRLDVTNTGSVAGDEVVQLYTRGPAPAPDDRPGLALPRRQLRGFQRIHLEPGQRGPVEFRLAAADLAFWDVVQGRFVLPSGRCQLLVGSSSVDIRQSAVVAVAGEPLPPRDATRPVRAADFDDCAGIRLVDETRVRGDAVRADPTGGWMLFGGVDFGAGTTGFRGRVARPGPGTSQLVLRLDDPVNGPVVGSAAVPTTGNRHHWVTTWCPVEPVTGRRDLYLVLGTGDCVADFQFDRGGGAGPDTTR